MSRRRRATKRIVEPDPLYNSVVLAKFINKVMLGGGKSTARSIVYKAIEAFAKKVSAEDPLQAFEEVLEKAMPILEVKSRRIGGATYQVPVEIDPERRQSLAMKWLINHARAKGGCGMVEGLTAELTDCHNGQGSTIKKKDDTHRMAEANKAFAHYRW